MSPIIGARGGISASDSGDFAIQPPLVPTLSGVTIIASNEVYVYFSPNPNGSRPKTYNVEVYCLNTGSIVYSNTGYTSSPAVVVYGFQGNYTYEYSVQAVNEAGISPWATLAYADIPNYIPPPYVPPPPPYRPPPYIPPPPPYIPPPYIPPPPPPPKPPPPPPPPPPKPPTGGCFIFGTSIWMADGTHKNVEDLLVGDVVMTALIPTYPNGENATLWYPPSVWSLPDSEIGQTTLQTTIVEANSTLTSSGYYSFNGTINVTGDHFMFVNRAGIWQMMRAWSVQVGDIFLNEQLTEVTITNVEVVKEMVTVAAVMVGPNDLFFGANTLTHNIVIKNSAY